MARKRRGGTGSGGVPRTPAGERGPRTDAAAKTAGSGNSPPPATFAIVLAASVILAVLATAYVMRAKGPSDVPGQPEVIAQDSVLNMLDKLADNFEAAGEQASSKKSSRDFGESLKASNQKTISEGLQPIAKIYKDAGLGFDSTISRKEDRWDPELAKEISQEVAKGLRALQ